MHAVNRRSTFRVATAALASLALALPAGAASAVDEPNPDPTATTQAAQADPNPVDPSASSADPTASAASTSDGTGTGTAGSSATGDSGATGGTAGSANSATNAAGSTGGDAIGTNTNTNTNVNGNQAAASVSGSGNSTNTISAAGVGNPTATATGASASVGSISISMPPLSLAFPPEFIALLRMLVSQQAERAVQGVVAPAVVAASGPARMIDVRSMRGGAAVVTVPVNRPVKLMLRGLPTNGSYRVMVAGQGGEWTTLGWRKSVSRMVLTPGLAALQPGPHLVRIDQLSGREMYVLLSARR